MAKANMLHATLHAVWVYNKLPQHGAGLPLKKYSLVSSARALVFHVPTYLAILFMYLIPDSSMETRSLNGTAVPVKAFLLASHPGTQLLFPSS